MDRRLTPSFNDIRDFFIVNHFLRESCGTSREKQNPMTGNVDLQTSTINGLIKQIRKSNEYPTLPELTDVWICDISPQDIKAMLRFISEYIKDVDEYDFTNLKRMKLTKTDKGVSILLLICSCYCYNSRDRLMELLKEGWIGDLDTEMLNIRKAQVPTTIPKTKDESIQWSERYWPISWKGNPNHRDLMNARFDFFQEAALIDKLVELASASESVKSATLIARQDEEGKLTILTTASDCRQTHPLKHSVMIAIDMIAQIEKENRLKGSLISSTSYLCQDLLVYTTHEPCIMCSMALVHSRISRLTYIWPHALGGIESSHFIGDRKDLNWKFQIWRWVGPTELEIGLSSSIHP